MDLIVSNTYAFIAGAAITGTAMFLAFLGAIVISGEVDDE